MAVPGTEAVDKYVIGVLSTEQICLRDSRQYSTIRKNGAESLQGLTETAGLPKYHTIFGPGFSIFIFF